MEIRNIADPIQFKRVEIVGWSLGVVGNKGDGRGGSRGREEQG